MLSQEELNAALDGTVQTLNELRTDFHAIATAARAVPEDMEAYTLFATKLDVLIDLLDGKTWQASNGIAPDEPASVAAGGYSDTYDEPTEA